MIPTLLWWSTPFDTDPDFPATSGDDLRAGITRVLDMITTDRAAGVKPKVILIAVTGDLLALLNGGGE